MSAVLALVQYLGSSGPLHPWVSPTRAGEAFANLRQRNQLATLLSMGVAAVLLVHRPGPGRHWEWPVLVALCAASAASSSRTGLLQLGLVSAGVFLWRRQAGTQQRRDWLWCVSPVLLHTLFSILLPSALLALRGEPGGSVYLRIESALDDGFASCNSRWILWGNVLHLIAQKPWAGWGWGELDYAHYATLYPGTRFCDILDNAHNLPLHLAVEWGIPVSAAFCALAAWGIVRGRPWRDTDPLRRVAWMFLLLMGVHSLVEYPLWYGPFQVAAALSVATLAAPALRRRFDAVILRNTTLLGSAAVLALCALAGHDYWRVMQLYLPPAERAAQWREDPRPAARGVVFFRAHAQFAELTTTQLTRANAAGVHTLAQDVIHFSPEPKVIESLIDSAIQLGRSEEALLDIMRFRAAFPQEYAAWRERSGLPPAASPAS